MLRKWSIRLLIYLALTGFAFLIGIHFLQVDRGYPPSTDLEEQKQLYQLWVLAFTLLLVLPCMIYSVFGGIHVFQNGPRRYPCWQTAIVALLLTATTLLHGSLAGLAFIFWFQ
ncbi:hypothetical protein [Desmospora activa]|uniref:Uncharacterized protein n=1 Tax=Desmospora activa DSM 45169 TaxID=1121389 RepID=A0A2T4Z6G7_9BACL|nr:hypothetical protein [Desmospora activa]PTM57489.1 hypothetical protein C8J48_0037 [Desmospora activa DSM 45169]